MSEVEKSFNKLRKKYGLPPLKRLMMEFGIKPETPELVLHETTEKILEKVSSTAKILESVIFISTGSLPSQLYEANMIKDKKDEVFKLYKKLMQTYWSGEGALLSGDEKEISQFINRVFHEWTGKIKKELMSICELFQKEWKDAKLRESKDFMYHG